METDNKSPRAGYFGEFGGQFIPEALMTPLNELIEAYETAKNDEGFWAEWRGYLKDYVGRPSPLFEAKRLSEKLGGARIFLKREDVNHTGSHKINNTLGQAMLAKRMGKTRLIAETGAGMHGVATATVAALFNMECLIFMGAKDIERQEPNVFRMRMLGASLHSATSGSATLKDAMNEALRDWVATVDNTFYVIGSVAGPHPYPLMVRDFQQVIGQELKAQITEATGRLPDMIIACVGGGSNAMGVFHPFVGDKAVALRGVEAAGDGLDTDSHAASINGGEVGVLHGSKSYLLQERSGQIKEAHSISAGLDYPGIGPEHSHLHTTGRAVYSAVTDSEAVSAAFDLTRYEGIIPALESAHAVAEAIKVAPTLGKDKIVVVNLSGRGDKDLDSLFKFAPDEFKTVL